MEIEENEPLTNNKRSVIQNSKTNNSSHKKENYYKLFGVALMLMIITLVVLLMKVKNQDTTLNNLESLVNILISQSKEQRQMSQNFDQLRQKNQTQIRQIIRSELRRVDQNLNQNVKTLQNKFDSLKMRLSKLIQDQQEIIRQNEARKLKQQEEQQRKAKAEIAQKAQSKQHKKKVQNKMQGQTDIFQKQTQNYYGKQNMQKLSTKLAIIQTQAKQHFHDKKIIFLKSLLEQQVMKSQKFRTSYLLSMANLNTIHQNAIVRYDLKILHQKQTERLYKTYPVTKYKVQLFFCIVVPTYNNAKDYRYEYNIQSILNLNYQNYRTIIIDDNSNDGTPDLIQEVLDRLDVNNKIKLVRNNKQMTAVYNIYLVVTKYCKYNDIIVLVDGDDQLLGRQALKVFNAVYQQKKVDVVYSNHVKMHWHEKKVNLGWSLPYTDNQKKNNFYRQVIQKIAHLRSFKASLFLKIKVDDLKDENGEWLRSTYDEVICLPILQMSCGRIQYIDQYFYFYNFGIGSNDLMVDGGLQKQVANYIRYKKPKYHCLDEEIDIKSEQVVNKKSKHN